MRKKLLVVLAIVFVLIQFIRSPKNNGKAFTSTDVTHYLIVPDSILSILKVSCFDCHSNHTNYPWYSYINPVSWWLNDHIQEGKREVNFSDFSKYTKEEIDKKLKETIDMVKRDVMPLKSYLLIHTDAKLTKQQIQKIVKWAQTERQRLRQDLY
ncbi:MAG: heme-binding domain-containing protein [Chitinophagaceae bacterium]|nr:heme-binding domain-containing protein [Chitinophagaceae bacterium]